MGSSRGRAAVADDGAWRLDLSPLPAGGPHSMTVEGDGQITVEDVLVGEVWVGSGQSNMQWSVGLSDDAEAEIAAADWPRIRLFSVKRTTASSPQDDVNASWMVCSPETVGSFSAVSYHFGRHLHRDLGVPVGLIHTSWGGTRIEPWTDLASVRALETRLEGTAQAGLQEWLERVTAFERPQKERDEIQRRFDASLKALWAAEADSVGAPQTVAGYDDSGWPTMEVPDWWENGGLADFDGLVWFRKRLLVPAAWAGRDLTLHLGPVDEADITWFDGVRIGATGSFTEGVIEFWDDPRTYTVPGRLVEGGEAVLVVRAIDSARAGGLWGSPPEEMYLTPADGDGSQRVDLAGAWRYEPGARLAPRPDAAGTQQLPGFLYNAMIHPLIPYSIRGAIWYQGESNRGEGAAYGRKMEALIDSWRGLWGPPRFPFLFVQLAPFRYGGDELALPEIWEAQADVLQTVPNTGMAIITDVGDLDDIHPTDKQTVGQRLALLALAGTYDRAVVGSGPLYLGMEIDEGVARLSFEHAGGLRSADGQPLSWFEIAGRDSQFVAASAVVSGTSVEVSSPQVPAPIAVRFGWHQEAEPNLVNGAGLPAGPFRTHRW